ncbi:hypothetical protein [Streptomyces pinistramenti]|uniref:hypothetical protein n=1 Tax=Streptomyces pinistramenti TaxID=2884812 RepID=UPI001D05D8A5|nr:hypothetical protein [Streptomyces pinistramenti]MCB5909714.1 hypothetical protein [Streptomyces pinistramenti]
MTLVLPAADEIGLACRQTHRVVAVLDPAADDSPLRRALFGAPATRSACRRPRATAAVTSAPSRPRPGT